MSGRGCDNHRRRACGSRSTRSISTTWRDTSGTTCATPSSSSLPRWKSFTSASIPTSPPEKSRPSWISCAAYREDLYPARLPTTSSIHTSSTTALRVISLLLLDLMGCCPPEGMRALWIAWRRTVTPKESGIHINMCLPCKHEEAEVVTYPPETGMLTVIAGKQADYFIRPPSWAPRERVRVSRNGSPVLADWKGDYIRVKNASMGEKMSIAYPVVDFVQEYDLDAAANSAKYRVTWRGNTVTGIEPDGKYMPFFRTRKAL